MAPDALLFDLDGTLIDSLSDIHASVTDAYRQHHLTPRPTPEEVRTCMGQGVKKLAIQLLARHPHPVTTLSAQQLSQTIQHTYQQRADAGIHQTTLYPDVSTLLATLSKQYPLAIVTNRPEEHARYLIHQHQLDHYCLSIIGQREGRPPKPDPAGLYEACCILSVQPHRCYFVGDAAFDQQAAAAAHMTFIWARYGYQQHTHPLEPTPTKIIDQPIDVYTYL